MKTITKFRCFLIACLSLVMMGMLMSGACAMEAKNYTDQVAVYGSLGAGFGNKPVSVLLVKKTATEDSLVFSDIGYMNDSVTATDGSYTFKFKFDGDVTDYVVRVNQNGENVTDTVTEATYIRDFTNATLQIDPAYSSMKASLNISNLFGKEDLTCMLLVAFYDESEKLIAAEVVEKDIATDADTHAELTVDIPEGAITAKAFAFGNMLTSLANHVQYTCGTIENVNVLWPGFTSKAFTLSYDDGAVDNDNKMIALMNQYGVYGTFNLYFNYTDLDTRYTTKGQEIANHIYGHPAMSNKDSDGNYIMSLEDCKKAIDDGKMYIEDNSTEIVRGLVWPYSVPSVRPDYQEILQYLRDNGYTYARNSGQNGKFDLPADWMEWNCTAHYGSKDDFWTQFKNMEQGTELKLFSIWGHSFEFSTDEHWTEFESFMKDVNAQDDIWCATNKDIVAYANASKRLIFTSSSVTNPTEIDLYVVINGEKRVLKAGETLSR